MQTTLLSFLVFILIFAPGAPAEASVTMLAGANWYEDWGDRSLRIILFSLFGLATYSILADSMGLPIPEYVTAEFFNYENPWGAEKMASMSVAYFGHTLTSLMFGIGLAVIRRTALPRAKGTFYSHPWDDMLQERMPNGWVVVSLTTGEAFAGEVEVASQNADNRAILLREPEKYIEAEETYRKLSYQHLYLPSSLVESVGVTAISSINTDTEGQSPAPPPSSFLNDS